MKINKYYLVRGIMPIACGIAYLFTKENQILWFGLGYLFCWLFGFPYVIGEKTE